MVIYLHLYLLVSQYTQICVLSVSKQLLNLPNKWLKLALKDRKSVV